MALTSADRGARPLGWLVGVMLAAGVAFVVLRLVTPDDGTQVPPRTWSWTGDGVLVQAPPGGTLRDGDLVTAIDGAALGGPGGWRAPAHRLGERLDYQVVRDGETREEPVTLRRARVADRLVGAWGTVLFVVALFVVVAYLYGRRPGPATGALLVLGAGLLSSDVTLEIGVSALDARGGPVLWLYLLNTQVVYVMGWAGLAAFVLLFPRPWAPLARRRRLLWVVCATPVLLVVALALAALADGIGLTGWVGRVIAAETFVSVAVLGASIVAALARYLSATDPVGRQQLKWLAGGAFVSGALALTIWFLPELVVGESLLPASWLGFSGLPLLAGLTVAVLRYRLFDVDRVVSRTLAYGLLTLLLGGGYALVVLGLGQLLGRDSSLVVAAATLAVAALFQPARRRVQALVDRRFNRRHHDTAQTIAAFSARLREQVDLDTLSAEVLAVAEQTMEPTMLSLWIRPPAERAGGRPVP
jgi:hypothetical protein